MAITMSFASFKEYAKRYGKDNPNMRRGQAFFNALNHVRPDLANKVRSTELDPFYRDERVFETHDFVERNW